MSEFSISRIITHHFHGENEDGDTGIVYDMIIGLYFMEKIGLIYNFKQNVLEWDETYAYRK